MQRVKEESQIIQTVSENRQAGNRGVLSLANFSSSGREERGKKITPQPRTAVQQTRKNEFPAGKQQNFPKATFARSSWPPPFHPQLICSAIQRSAGIPLRRNPPQGCSSPGTDLPARRARGPEQVSAEGKGRSGAAAAVSRFPGRPED